MMIKLYSSQGGQPYYYKINENNGVNINKRCQRLPFQR